MMKENLLIEDRSIFLSDIQCFDLTNDEMLDIEGGSWATVGRVALRVAVGAAGVGTGVGVAIGAGLLAYEIYQALS